jgi:NADPH-dependent curcumin reductase CurA
MPGRNKRFVLAERPVGFPKETDFRLEEVSVPDLAEGQVLIRVEYLSVDPYQRGRMNAGPSYAPGVEIGGVMVGGGVGKVAVSRSPDFKEGETVVGQTGWQTMAVCDAQGLRKVDGSLAPVSTALGVLGMPGLTAYFGLLEIGEPKEGETVVVSAGAGAVGSLVGQIAKIKGCRVIGIAGSDEKISYITRTLGFDDAFNYKAVKNYGRVLRSLCPQGVDVYYDNVGGVITDAVLRLINLRARVVVCGQVSQYNLMRPEMGPRFLWQLIVNRARIEGFLVSDFADRYPQGLQQMAAWLHEGRIRYREDIVEGFENTPRAFIGMLQGENTGKQLVRVS